MIIPANEQTSAAVAQHYDDLESLEQRLTVLEEKMIATARARQSDEQLLEARQELDRQLRPYRGKMTADQLTMLEKQYRIFAPTLPGHPGGAPWPAGQEPTLQAIADMLAQDLAQRKIDRPHLAGNSLGGERTAKPRDMTAHP